MIYLSPHLIQDVKCCLCGRGVVQGDEFYGPMNWKRHQFTCRHETQWECPSCRYESDKLPQCSVCGCDEEYC